mmetsp:Transcript_6605/g.17140  ORF Transcript_6605/g.17140 Transcript_6605/m.17140 type:complete len:231 (+) Transcript_6605:823-1515(+)
MLGAVAGACARRLARRCVCCREMLRRDVLVHEVTQREGELVLRLGRELEGRLSKLRQLEPLLSELPIHAVRQLDHHLVCRVHHRRRRRILGVGKLGGRRPERILEVDGDNELVVGALGGDDLLVAARRELELCLLVLLYTYLKLHHPRVVHSVDGLRERGEHGVDELRQLAVGIILGRLECGLLGGEGGEQVAERHVQAHLQHTVAPQRAADWVRLAHVHRHVRDLYRPQ